MVFPEHQHGRDRRQRDDPEAAEPEIDEDEGREDDTRCEAHAEVAEADALRWGVRHPARAPKRRSRCPNRMTSAANISAVKSGQRVSTKESSA
jgi:hypothetical protein